MMDVAQGGPKPHAWGICAPLSRLRQHVEAERLGLPIAFAVAATILLVLRIHYGVDVTDEGIYSVLPLRFARGARPFLDELSPLQGSGVAMLPFVWMYTRLRGVTGLVLALRYVYLVLMVVSALCSFAFLKRLISSRIALALSFAPLVFLPWGMPSAGYGNTAMIVSAIAVSLGGYCVVGATRFRTACAFTAGLCSAFAALCYPTTSVVLLVAFAWLWRRTRSGKVALAFLAGCCVVALPALLVFVRGAAGIHDFLAYVKATTHNPVDGKIPTYAGGLDKIPRLGGQAWEFIRALKRLWVALAVVLVLRFGKSWAPFAIAFAVVWCALPLLVLRPTDVATTIVMSLHLLALTVYALNREIRSPGLTWALSISTLYALVIIYTSTGEFGVFAVGSLVALPPILLVLALPSLRSTQRPRLAQAATAAALGLIVLVGTYSMWTAAWQDGRPVDLHTRVMSGAYRGLYTTPEKVLMLRQLTGDLQRWATPRDVVLAYDENPGVYLLGDFAAVPTSMWYGNADSYSVETTDLLLDILTRRGQLPTVVVRNTLHKSYPPDHLTNRWVEANYKVAVSRPGYDILVPK